MPPASDEILHKYEEEVKHLTSMCDHLGRERKQINYLLVGAALSPLAAFWKPVLGLGLVALFLTLFFTGLYFNFVHRNERAGHLENAREELARLRRARGIEDDEGDA